MVSFDFSVSMACVRASLGNFFYTRTPTIEKFALSRACGCFDCKQKCEAKIAHSVFR